uniref:Uncharacterized protein n=1 Tax=Romanomermis culicivorax TaxID=13658 RepID=A0A915L5Y9_ROMCU
MRTKQKEKSTYEMPVSSVLRKVKDFLPEIREANNALPSTAISVNEADSIVQLIEKNGMEDATAECSEGQLNMDLALFQYNSDSDSDVSGDASDDDNNSTVPRNPTSEKGCSDLENENLISVLLKNDGESKSQTTKFSLRMPKT